MLFEIGTEEIPSVYLTDFLSQLEKNTRSILSEFRIAFSGIEVYGTPRRLFVHVSGMEEFQGSYTEEIVGPPTKIGFDEKGNPTKATLSFLKKNKVKLPNLKRKETPKGERLFLEILHAGNKTVNILSTAIISIIRSFSSPKSMRWQKGNFQFVRPIRWILALYGGEVIPLKLEEDELEEVALYLPKFGNKTYGHRFLSEGFIEIKNFDDYMEKLNENFVIPISSKNNSGSRFRLIEKGVMEAALNLGCVPALDEVGFQYLVEKVSNLVEWPKIIECEFDEKYLKIPEEVIVNTLESNQRFFALRDKEKGDITSQFIAVSNIETENMDIIKKGYERVVQARLEDAEFYWEKDLAVSLEKMAEKLNDVIYHPKLGSSMEKVLRFSKLSLDLCDEFYPNEKDLQKNVIEISRLCKADLTSGMVYEFPELQGVMGKYFAQIQGKNKIISNCIYEHYLPIRDGDLVPSLKEGAIVSLSDRFDTVVGLIGLNYVPKGSEDPYALRRTTAGIFKIISTFGFRIDLSEMIDKSLLTFNDIFNENKNVVVERLNVFLSSRVHAFLIQNTSRSDLVESVFSVDNDNAWRFPLEALGKLKLLEEIVDDEVFKDCSAIYKRIFNITKKNRFSSLENIDNDFGLSDIKDSVFTQQEEKLLFVHLDESVHQVNDILESFKNIKIYSINKMKEQYKEIFKIMCSLIVPVDSFFDNVLIMDDDKSIRENRLNILKCMRSFFSLICDFTKVHK